MHGCEIQNVNKKYRKEARSSKILKQFSLNINIIFCSPSPLPDEFIYVGSNYFGRNLELNRNKERAKPTSAPAESFYLLNDAHVLLHNKKLLEALDYKTPTQN